MTKKAKASSLNIGSFAAMKAAGEKISMITAYDYAMGKCAVQAGIDLILSETAWEWWCWVMIIPCKSSIEDMIHHSAAVRRGARKPLSLSICLLCLIILAVSKPKKMQPGY
jgi:3-methyl-2-oxobutanoate hydroxymethyltransferase